MPYLTASAGLNNHIRFIGGMYAPYPGGLRRWTEAALLPSVLYDGNRATERRTRDTRDRRYKRYFGGLLFEPGCDAVGGLISPRYLGMAGPAGQSGWEHTVFELFAPGLNVRAALELTKRLPPGEHSDIWIALPYPPGNQKQPFGSVRGQSIRFADSAEARATALLWWIDLVREAWGSVAGPEHRARLAGFAWLKNYLSPEDEQLMQAVSRHVRSRGQRLMWCQNYGTAKAHLGAGLGFDLVFTRPTYLDIEQRRDDWVKTASGFSNEYGLGLILWEPDGSRERIEKLLRLGEDATAGTGAFQLYEFGTNRRGDWIRPDDPIYETLYRYMKKVGAADDGKGGVPDEDFA